MLRNMLDIVRPDKGEVGIILTVHSELDPARMPGTYSGNLPQALGHLVEEPRQGPLTVLGLWVLLCPHQHL